MNVSELLDSAIDEIERVLIGNKDRSVEEVYLRNAIRHIREYGSQPQLNSNQQIVLEWLKKEYFDSYVKSVLSNLYFYVNLTAVGDLENEEIKSMVDAYEKLEDKEFAQVLQAFASWVEQEVERW